MGAEGFHGRVRNGIGCWDLRYGHQVVERPDNRMKLDLIPLRAGAGDRYRSTGSRHRL